METPDIIAKIDEIMEDLKKRRSEVATAACRHREELRAKIERLHEEANCSPYDAEWDRYGQQLTEFLTLRQLFDQALDAAREDGRHDAAKTLDATIDECRNLQDQCENLREEFGGIKQAAKDLKATAETVFDELCGLHRDIAALQASADDIEKQAGTVIQTVEEITTPVIVEAPKDL